MERSICTEITRVKLAHKYDCIKDKDKYVMHVVIQKKNLMCVFAQIHGYISVHTR